MPVKTVVRVLLAAGVLLSVPTAGCVAEAGDVIVNPHLTTDRSIDTASVETIVAGLVKPGMSDRDKALAVYNYVRRVMFHYRHLTRVGGGGATDLINGIGYTLCTPTAGMQVELSEAAGVKAKILSTPGHGSCTVFFDGKRHWMDAFLGGCVWDKDRKSIADLNQIVADPALMKRAEPSPAPLFPCGDVLYADALRFEPDNKTYHEACGPDDAAWTARAKRGKTSGSYWKSRMTLAIALRPGERYVRRWDHVPGMYFLTKVQEKFAPPHHFCGVEAEKRDTVNWPYFKPYVKEITSFDPKTGKKVTVKTGRYWANGQLTWAPDLSSPGALKHFAKVENVRFRDGALAPIDAAKPAVLEWLVKCPYILQGGQLRLVAGRKAIAFIATGRSEHYVPLKMQPGDPADFGDLRPHFLNAKGKREYTLRVVLTGADARLTGLSLDTLFQHNMYSLPQLMPGRNEVKVVAANPEALNRTRFIVEYAWDQAGKPKTERRVIDKSPYTFTIQIPGEDLPRMRHLLFANEG